MKLTVNLVDGKSIVVMEPDVSEGMYEDLLDEIDSGYEQTKWRLRGKRTVIFHKYITSIEFEGEEE